MAPKKHKQPATTSSQPLPVPQPLTDVLRCPAGAVDLSALDAAGTPGFPGTKGDAPALASALTSELSELQERLFASGRLGRAGTPAVLVILQGMDTSGKGGVIRHAIGMVDPQGVQIKAFKAPTAEERAHHYLWRIKRELPPPGIIGIFDRSQYEDVLIVRVNSLVEESVWSARYEEINTWEEQLVTSGTLLVKCFLHISSSEQRQRLSARLEDPSKHWKYSPGDIDERSKWPEYWRASRGMLERCSTQHAPWYVIPSDKKWYRNWAVAQLLLERLRSLDLSWPVADFDVEVEKARLAST